MDPPCRYTISSSKYSSIFTTTDVIFSVDMRKMMVKRATSNSGLTPMKEPPTGFTKPFQLNCRFRTWSSSSGYKTMTKRNSNIYLLFSNSNISCSYRQLHSIKTKVNKQLNADYNAEDDTVFSYCVFVVSCFVAFVVNVALFFLQVEVDPVVKTHDLLAKFGFSNKHMFKSTGILTMLEKKPVCSAVDSFPTLNLIFSLKKKVKY